MKVRTSIQDVARLAGVAVGTVSNVLNQPEKVRPQTIERVNKAIIQLGFIRNDAARLLKAGTSRSIGLVVLDSSNPFFGQLTRGAEDAADENGYALISSSSSNDEVREKRYINLFEEQRMAGVLVSPAGNATGLVSQLKTKGFKTVLVDRMEDPELCCSVGLDDVAGGRIAVEHLLGLGRKRIAFVSGPSKIRQVSDRLSGAREAVAQSPSSVLEVFEGEAQTVLTGRKLGEQILALAKKDRPDAIFAANDLLAVGVLQAFVFGNQVSVPEEIAIIGYDDIDFASAAVVPLSSVRQNANLIGSSAVALLLDEIKEGEQHIHRQISFKPELVIRASTTGNQIKP